MHNTDTRTFAQTTHSRNQPFAKPAQEYRRLHRWLIGTLLCLSLLLSATHNIASANAETVHSGTLIFHHEGNRSGALLLDASMDVKVEGLLAELTLTQSFQNNSTHWVDASYLFPMSEDAAIQGLRIRIGERIITGHIEPRAKAKETFEAAQQAGMVASLVEQQRPNLFTTQVSNIAPGELLDVTLAVMVPVTVKDGQLELTLPTTLTPRYSKEHTADALDTPFIMPSQGRGPQLSLNAQIAPLDNYALVSSQSHEIHHTESGLQINNVAMDRDLTLRWPLAQSATTSSYAFTTQHDGKRYVQLMVNPPEQVLEQTQTQRELILVVDKSGSMAGVSMEAAKEALQYALDELSVDDYFNIIAFDNNEHALFKTPQPATQQWKEMARSFTSRLQADGGTEMEAALQLAMQVNSDNNDDSEGNNNNRLRQIVFLTDGSVGYEDALLSMIKRQLGHSRLFTVGIGHAPNTWFLEKAAQAGRGVALSIQDEHDVAQSVTQLLSALAHPVITDISVQYPQGHGELYPRPVPDLYADNPGMWVARISEEVEEIVITGKRQGQRWKRVVRLNTEDIDNNSNPLYKQHAPAVAMHWTRQKIESLLDEQRYSADPERHEDVITQLALGVGLMTRYTSFVAVEETPSRPEHQGAIDLQVANLLPAGNSMMLKMPQGAAGIDTLAWLSALLGAGGLGLTAIGLRGRRERCGAQI